MPVDLNALKNIIMPGITGVNAGPIIYDGPFSPHELHYIQYLKEYAKDDIVFYIHEELIGLSKTEYVIAGGAFASLYHGEPVRDIDVFILDIPHAIDHVVHQFNRAKPNGLMDSLSYNMTFMINRKSSEYVKALGNDMIRGVITATPSIMKEKAVEKYAKWEKTNVQFILTKYKTREELIEHFDFAHCQMNYYDGKLYVSPRTFNAIKNKELINNQDKVQHWRIEKYKAKGYSYKIEHSTVPLRNKILSEYIDEHIKKILDRKTTA